MSEDTTEDLATLLRVEQYFISCVLSIERIDYQFEKRDKFSSNLLEQEVTHYLANVSTFMHSSCSMEFGTLDLLQEQLSELHSEYDRLKAKLLIEGTRAQISITQMSESIDCLSEVFRLAQEWHKGQFRIKTLQGKLDFKDSPVPEVVAEV